MSVKKRIEIGKKDKKANDLFFNKPQVSSMVFGAGKSYRDLSTLSIKCSECGRFCKPCDRGVPFGSITSTEPPDEEYFCEKCSKKLEQYYLNKKRIPQYWIKPNWVINVENKVKAI